MPSLTQSVRNSVRGFFQKFGPSGLKSYLWNREFSSGQWRCLEETTGDSLYPCLEKYLNCGSILDLGCGSGNTGTELARTAYLSYTGVDISEVAIDRAKKRTNEDGRAGMNRYLQGDICNYKPTQQFDVILFRDSIYYVPLGKIKGMLDRYSKSLNQGGVFIVRMWSVGGKFKARADIIERDFKILEKIRGQSETIIIVFRHSSI